MGSLTAISVRDGDVGMTPASLSDRLVWLCRFGKPRVGVYGSNWHACIEMNTNTTGTSFEVKSEFKHTTPDEAVDVLITRMLDALKALKVSP